MSWSSSQSLSSLVDAAVVRGRPGLAHRLRAQLRDNKHKFVALLKNPPRNAADADLVRRAQTEGIRLENDGVVAAAAAAAASADPASSAGRNKLPAAVVEEALILAEMFDLNEIASLQLLLKGEEQLSQYPGMTRGLVAVLLYYDSRRCTAQALRTLAQAHQAGHGGANSAGQQNTGGLTWTLGCPEDVREAVAEFNAQLLEDGIIEKILRLLDELSWEREAMTLQRNLALGSARHRRQVRDLFEDTRQCLADAVFAFAAQSGLGRNDTVRLLDYLSRKKSGDSDSGSGALDPAVLTLVMALLYAIDVGALQKCEDASALSLPILRDAAFVPSLHREIAASHPNARAWADAGVQSLVQLGWAVAVSALRAVPGGGDAWADVAEEDEVVMDLALDNKVFHHLPSLLLRHPHFRSEEFYLRRMHHLLTDVVVLMPLKVKELRNRADDAARNAQMHEQEGVHYQVPLSGQHFEHLLRSIAALYDCDDDDLGDKGGENALSNLGLVMDYWCPPDAVNSSVVERCPQRQVSLFKFVRLAGDLLMPSLYVPYLQLLSSLAGHPQAALHCFNLLKLNGLSSASPSSHPSTVSWDHFFASLQRYFANLRQEQTDPKAMLLPIADTIYRPQSRPVTRGISPAEVRGLVAVMKLMQSVSDHCEAARIALAENASWQPLLVTVGLLGCPVPPELKSRLLRALASLARSPEVAGVVWQNVESAQLIATTNPGGLTKSGLGAELESVEARAEDFQMTRAFLHLLDVLTDCMIPGTLGAGTRQPGFEPYLTYVRDHVFLKFNGRSYRDPREKWQVVSSCLHLFCKILSEYSPSAVDFAKTGSVSQTDPNVPAASGKHPGFFLLLDLFQSSELLRLLLYVVDEGASVLERYQPFPGKDMVERSCLLSLRLLSSALERERDFLDAAKAADTPIMLTALSQLLQGVNPRSGRADHMLSVGKFVTFHWWLPKSAANAVKIIAKVSDAPGSQPGLLSALNPTEDVGRAVVKGFTDILDHDGGGGDGEQDEQDADDARVQVLNLLLGGLEKPAPSLSHFLLGFDLKAPLSRTNLQPPGVMGAVRTPLHAVLALLRPPSPLTPPPALSTCPQLCESAYRLIFHLAANANTSEPTLRYLRSSEDFLSTQLSLLPLPAEVSTSPQVQRGVAFLLKTVAIELKLVSASRLRSQVSLLTQLLLESRQLDKGGENESLFGAAGPSSSTIVAPEDQGALAQLSRSNRTVAAPSTAAASGATAMQQQQQQQHRLLQMLNAIDFEEETLELPNWEVLDSAQVGQVMSSCERRGPHGGGERRVDVARLHRILNDELSGLLAQGGGGATSAAAVAQRQLVQQEVKSILLYAVSWNSLQDRHSVRRHLLDAWRQVAEVLLLCTASSSSSDLLTPAARRQLLLDLLQTLLNKVLADGTMPELANQVSGVVLLLLTALRRTYDSSAGAAAGDDANKKSGGSSSNYVSILDSSVRVGGPSAKAAAAGSVYSTALQVVLRGLVAWIGNTSSAAQRVRSNLYGALLNYLRIGKDEGSPSSSSGAAMSGLTADSDRGRFRKANLEVLQDFGGDNFLDTLCRDTASGHDIRRMLALSVLDELICLDARGGWTHYMSNQGYLRHLIESFSSLDGSLSRLISGDGSSSSDLDLDLRPLYVYESKMAMLARTAAATAAGAELLLESGVMLRMAEMTVFSSRPDVTSLTPSDAMMDLDGGGDSVIPSPMDRYRQILFPALRLCQALLSSLGSTNASATAQVRHFVLANEELARAVLRPSPAAAAGWTLAQLQELALLTGVIAKSFSSSEDDPADSPTSAADLELSAGASKIRRLMLSLVPLCQLRQDTISGIQTSLPAPHRPRALTLLLETSANVLAFARGVAFGQSGRGGQRNNAFQVVFAPSLADAVQRGQQESSTGAASTTSSSTFLPNRSPALSHLAHLLRNACSLLLSLGAEVRDLRAKLDSADHFSAGELSALILSTDGCAAVGGLALERMSAADKRATAKAKITASLFRKSHDLRLSESVLESAALLCHGHLEHFLLALKGGANVSSVYQRAAHRRGMPRDMLNASPDVSLLDSSLSMRGAAAAAAGGDGHEAQEGALQSLREDARLCFNDAFYLRLDDVRQQMEAGNKSGRDEAAFLAVVARRMRRITAIHA